MHRSSFKASGLALTLALAACGCRTPRNEVPPGRPYASDGRQLPPVGLSTDPHPGLGDAMSGGAPYVDGSSPSASQFPGSSPSMANYGAPTANSYGPPGTSAGSGDYPPPYNPAPAPAATQPLAAPAEPAPGVTLPDAALDMPATPPNPL